MRFNSNWTIAQLIYYTNPNRIYPPIKASIKTKSIKELLVLIKNKQHVTYGTVSKTNFFEFPVFPNEDYDMQIFSYSSSSPIIRKKVRFSKKRRSQDLDISGESPLIITKNTVISQIKQFFSGKFHGFDKDYSAKLELLKKITGKNYMDNYRRGGRLEFLFFDLLSHLKNEGIIDEVFWFGTNKEFQIATPAPGGKQANPDIIFEIDNYLFVVELTTIRGIRAQWNSSEASSVPDHIVKMKKQNPSKKIIGIFSAPSIHSQLEQNFTLNAKKEKVGMICEPCVKFAEFLGQSNRDELKKSLIQKTTEQLPR